MVADEVRTLAQRTQASTTEIRDMIETLQQGAADAVQVMSSGREQARASVGQVREAGSLLDGISAMISAINDLNTQIATAAEEQTSVSEEINRNINAIAGVADQTAEGARHTSDCCVRLADQTGQLRGLVEQFRSTSKD